MFLESQQLDHLPGRQHLSEHQRKWRFCSISFVPLPLYKGLMVYGHHWMTLCWKIACSQYSIWPPAVVGFPSRSIRFSWRQSILYVIFVQFKYEKATHVSKLISKHRESKFIFATPKQSDVLINSRSRQVNNGRTMRRFAFIMDIGICELLGSKLCRTSVA